MLIKLFTFRGHEAPVTALESDNNYLISGDDVGTIIIWELTYYRAIRKYPKLCQSRIQSLRLIELPIGDTKRRLLVAQSKRHGVFIYHTEDMFHPTSKYQICDVRWSIVGDPLIPIVNYPACEFSFSKGDTKMDAHGRAMLAYPSSIAKHIVTVRYVGPNAETLISGDAIKPTDEQSRDGIAWDIHIRMMKYGTQPRNRLFVGYDGCVIMYGFEFDKRTDVEESKCPELKIELLRRFDFENQDWIPSFDVKLQEEWDRVVIVAALPTKQICTFVASTYYMDGPIRIRYMKHEGRGMAAVKLIPNSRLFVSASWDHKVYVQAIRSMEILSSTEREQVEEFIFLDKPEVSNVFGMTYKSFVMCSASIDHTIELTCIQGRIFEEYE